MSGMEELEKLVADLEKKLRNQEKINHALKDRVKRSVRSTGDSYSMFESNILLQDAVHKKTRELEKAIVAATASTRAKSEFLANMSHEIRTPMNAITGMAYLLKQTDPTPRQHDYITKIETSAYALLRIINDILDISKIEAGRLDIEAIDFNLHKVIEDVTMLVEMNAAEKNLDFVVSYENDINMDLYGDPLRLAQILTNLVNNAVKFTAEGEVGVYVRSLAKDRFRFEVRDTGIGLTEEQQKRLFKSFSQADAGTTRKYGGTGLGLSICRHLVELMNGRIWVESEYGKGSSFIFEITLKEHDKPKRETGRFADKRVLIVDDTPSWQKILKNMLKQFSVHADVAGSGEEAVTMAGSREKPYDLILMDWRMPGMDGLRAAELIREHCKSMPPTIIMVSAFHQETLQHAAKKQGIDIYLHKPVNPSTLYDIITDFLGTGIVRDYRHKAESHSLKKKLTTLKGSTLLLAEDNPLNREIICGMLDQSGIIITEARNGKEAVDMYQAAPENYELILMDLQMPVMDGYDAAKEIRRIDPKVPIIAVSANAMTSDIEKTRQYGMNEHLNKPVDVEKFFSVLLAYIPQKCPEAQADGQADNQADAGPAAGNLPGFESVDTIAGLKYMMGDADLYARILGDFSENYDGIAEKLSHCISHDKEEAKRIVHTIKGLSAGIGAKSLHEAAVRFDESLAPDFFDPFIRELERVVDEIKESAIQRNDPPLAVNKKKPMSETRRDALMQKLVLAVKRHRPQLIGPVLEELNACHLKDADIQLLKEIIPLVKQYKFKDALDILAQKLLP
ncbi:MAG: hypothetical protein A2277_06325 [Desulfobacterales bacterium RIFOXYA12_FULL_46_15]|nr:MAG: hypothetical protein A2277_06325 [Desulfobacterales bacterium RIFOXYA12_FULL_46_15]